MYWIFNNVLLQIHCWLCRWKNLRKLLSIWWSCEVWNVVLSRLELPICAHTHRVSQRTTWTWFIIIIIIVITYSSEMTADKAQLFTTIRIVEWVKNSHISDSDNRIKLVISSADNSSRTRVGNLIKLFLNKALMIKSLLLRCVVFCVSWCRRLRRWYQHCWLKRTGIVAAARGMEYGFNMMRLNSASSAVANRSVTGGVLTSQWLQSVAPVTAAAALCRSVAFSRGS